MEEIIGSSLLLFKLQPLNLCKKKKKKNKLKTLLISEVNIRYYIIAEGCPITVLDSRAHTLLPFGEKTPIICKIQLIKNKS